LKNVLEKINPISIIYKQENRGKAYVKSIAGGRTIQEIEEKFKKLNVGKEV